jgi:DNA mismatch endonuclease Vsr
MNSNSIKNVKSKNTSIEIIFAKALHNKKVRFRKNANEIFGKPDIVIKKYKLAIFLDGDFWHGRDWETKKKEHKSNIDFWHKKIEGNIKRDHIVTERLEKTGWTVL